MTYAWSRSLSIMSFESRRDSTHTKPTTRLLTSATNIAPEDSAQSSNKPRMYALRIKEDSARFDSIECSKDCNSSKQPSKLALSLSSACRIVIALAIAFFSVYGSTLTSQFRGRTLCIGCRHSVFRSPLQPVVSRQRLSPKGRCQKSVRGTRAAKQAQSAPHLSVAMDGQMAGSRAAEKQHSLLLFRVGCIDFATKNSIRCSWGFRSHRQALGVRSRLGSHK